MHGNVADPNNLGIPDKEHDYPGETLESGAGLRSGEVTANELLDQWMRDHEAVVLRQVERIIRDHHLARDVVQETFIRAWRSAGTLHAGQGSLRGWLLKVARNLAIDRMRRASFKREYVSAEAPEGLAPMADHAEDVVATDHVHRLLAPLPPQHREVLYWTSVAGHSTEEVANMLHIPPGTVKSRRHYALRSLRRSLQDSHVADLVA